MMARAFFLFLSVLFLGAPAQALTWRAVVVQRDGKAELWTSEGERYPLRNDSLNPEFIGREIMAAGRLLPSRKLKPDTVQYAVIDRAGAYDAAAAAPRFLPDGRGSFAATRRVLPEAEMKPGAVITFDMPEMGKSASSGGSQPVRMAVSLPENYRRETPHPVILHFGGGTGGTDDWRRWREIAGARDFIIVAADYDHGENEKRGTLKIGTCRDFDSKIAYHALQILRNSTMLDPSTIILTGFSSGAYSITDNFKSSPKAWQRFSGFCAMGGGSKCGSAKIGSRPALFLIGEGDTQRHGWLDGAVADLRRGRPEKLTVERVPGVGHEWPEAYTPIIRKWLLNFPAVARPAKLEAMSADAPDDKIRAIVDSWRE